MENRALAERVKGMILYLRLRLIWEERVRKIERRDLERVLMLPPRRGWIGSHIHNCRFPAKMCKMDLKYSQVLHSSSTNYTKLEHVMRCLLHIPSYISFWSSSNWQFSHASRHHTEGLGSIQTYHEFIILIVFDWNFFFRFYVLSASQKNQKAGNIK